MKALFTILLALSSVSSFACQCADSDRVLRGSALLEGFMKQKFGPRITIVSVESLEKEKTPEEIQRNMCAYHCPTKLDLKYKVEFNFYDLNRDCTSVVRIQSSTDSISIKLEDSGCEKF